MTVPYRKIHIIGRTTNSTMWSGNGQGGYLVEQAAVWRKVDEYLEDRLIQRDPILEQVLLENRKAGIPAHDVSPLQGKLLHLLVRMHGAKRILEIGTLGGFIVPSGWRERCRPTAN